MKLYFRPEDPYSHPAFGELQPCTKFLLKISKKKVEDIQNVNDLDRISGHASADSLHIDQNNLIPQSTETTEHIVQPDCKSVSASSEVKEQIQNGAEEQLSADIVARISEAYHFDGDQFHIDRLFLQLAWVPGFLYVYLMPFLLYFLKGWWITSMCLLFMLIQDEARKEVWLI